MSPVPFAQSVNYTEVKLIEAGYNCLNFSNNLGNSYMKLFLLMYGHDTVVMCGNEKQIN